MLIIPLTEKISWRNPPIVTIGIILLNCLAADSFNTENIDDDTLVQYYLKMEQDASFLDRLSNDEIITPAHSQYAKWKVLRNEYESKRSRIVSFKYGFRPAHKSVLTSFTYMFLHGGFGHLFGNMLFLWIVGCMLEMGLGRINYIGLYIIGGLWWELPEPLQG